VRGITAITGQRSPDTAGRDTCVHVTEISEKSQKIHKLFRLGRWRCLQTPDMRDLQSSVKESTGVTILRFLSGSVTMVGYTSRTCYPA
jgi:hypothetical protein